MLRRRTIIGLRCLSAAIAAICVARVFFGLRWEGSVELSLVAAAAMLPIWPEDER